VVDRLKQSLENLDQPVCPSCRIEMKWTRSALVSADMISHLFHCPNCFRTGEATSVVRPVVLPLDKLSAPIHKRAA
jgi:hypothetical protein